MTTLPTNTTDRLLALADLTETTPELLDQKVWVDEESCISGNWSVPADWIGKRHLCDTAGCIAGNAVMLTPPEQARDLPADWHDAGQMALGIGGVLAIALFESDLPMTHPQIAQTLRALATLPEGKRTLDGAATVLDPRLYDLLLGDEEEEEEEEEEEDHEEDDECGECGAWAEDCTC